MKFLKTGGFMKAYFDKIYQHGFDSFVDFLKERVHKEDKTFVITANPETLMTGKENPDFDKILSDEKTIIVPDGIGVVKAANMLGYPVKERVTGVEIAETLLKIADEENKSVYLFGAKKEVVETLVKKIENDYSGAVIAGYSDGYVENRNAVFDDIAEKQPDIILVAFGIPVQEKLIADHLDKFNKGIFVGVGGSFDVISGTKKRAPEIFIKLNLEWLYRILKEPNRIGRFYRSNVKFISQIKKMR